MSDAMEENPDSKQENTEKNLAKNQGRKCAENLNNFDYTTATLKINLPEDNDSELVEELLELRGLHLKEVPLPDWENAEEDDGWGVYVPLKILSQKTKRPIYLVQDRNSHRLLVVKKLVAETEVEQKQQRFLEEAQILAQLQHSNVIPVYEIGLDTTTGELYYTMPYIPGKNLHNVLLNIYSSEKNTSFHWTLFRCLAMFREMCLGVAYAHSRGVCHRNLSPENIWLNENGQAYIIGWGACKAKGKGERIFDHNANHHLRKYGKLQTVDERSIGTLSYIAPEVIREKTKYLDERMDIYALGAILYELVVGVVPFHGENFEETTENICEKKLFIPFKGKKFRLSRTLKKILKKSLAKERKNRYSSVNELIEDLDKYMK